MASQIRKSLVWVIGWAMIWIAAGCQPGITAPQATPSLVASVMHTSIPILSPTSPSVTATTALTATATPTPVPLVSPLSSPLKDVAIGELPQIVTNAFNMPLTGRDDGHHGVDFAFYRWKDHIGIEGLEIYSIFNGKVTAKIENSQVYGKLVIIETPLDQLSAAFRQQLPAYHATTVPDNRLPCPTPGAIATSVSGQSLYILYGHMLEISNIQSGSGVLSGQTLGKVGNTGMSGNPHLHLEFRLGPANATFEGMSHYTAAASDQERYNYCYWRVSDTFQLLDPMKYLK